MIMDQKLSERRIVIAGGSGFLGLNLARYLADKDCEVVLLSRHQPTQEGPWEHVVWDARTVGPWAKYLEGATAVVNLAGRSVDCIKTAANCDEILRSRVEATNVLGLAVCEVQARPKVWIQMSTAHIYGDPSELVCDENSALGCGLAPTVGCAWEAAFRSLALPAMRRVILRTSFVMGQEGGALPRLAALARWGLGGKAGHGR
ncbi:MAG: NAD-dependent epimerase/dehydratase family protein [Planctomycetales bacterium]